MAAHLLAMAAGMSQSLAVAVRETAPARPVPGVSFIVPVRNDAIRLRRCLQTITANRDIAGRFEVVVADNGSTDDSGEIARAKGARVLDLPGRSVSQLRNTAAAAAFGEILVFVDADHEIATDWLVSAVETLNVEKVGAVGAQYTAPSNGTWVQRIYDLLRRRSAGIRDVEWLGSGNLAVWRHAFEAVNGFDESLRTCEDVDLCRRLRTAGFRILQDPRLRSIHRGDPSSLRALFWGELWRGRDNLRVSLRPPFVWRDLPSSIIPIADVAMFALVMCGLAMTSRMGVTLAALGLTGILIASSARAGRMVRHSDRGTPLVWVQALAVAIVYDAARAAALVWPGGHDARRNAER